MLPVSRLEARQDVSGQTSSASPELLAAQERLIKLRQQLGVGQGAIGAHVSHGRFSPSPSQPTWADLAGLPDHLGWHSAPATAVLRPILTPPPQTAVPPVASYPSEAEQRPSTPPSSIKLYPDLALALLRRNQTAPGRVWLLLRAADVAGSGWVDIQPARQLLTDKRSNKRICGWRQLRNLLHQGDGLFWRWENGRLWLTSVAKVATGLGVVRLSQRAVTFPVSLLTQPLGMVRAHFYASFHSSRQDRANQHHPPAPIARSTLSQLACISAHTQRAYEKRAGVRKQTNFAIGNLSTPEEAQEAGWRQGGALFLLKDYEGTRGRPGAVYLAWQIPNSYHGPHRIAARGRQKRINQQLADLFQDGMTGNDQAEIGAHGCLAKRYFANGRSAAHQFNRSNNLHELYWFNPLHRFSQVWNVLCPPLNHS